MVELVWWSNQGKRSSNVWTYNFSTVSTSLQAHPPLSETISGQSRCCTHTSSTAVVSSDAFQIMTDCWHTRRHSHIITQPQTQTLFLSHMYTNFLRTFSSPHRHTPRHPCQTVPTAVEIWSTFSQSPQGEIHRECSPDLHWFWKTSRANSCVLFIGEWYDRSNSESTHTA